MGKKGLFSLFALFLLALMPYACAEIGTGNLDHVYNLGDKISLNFNVSEMRALSGKVALTLNCVNENGNLNSLQMGSNPSYIYVKSGQEVYVSSELPLSEDIAMEKNLIGDCYIRISIEDLGGNIIETKNSGDFQITDKINITAKLNREYFLPGEQITVSGLAIKMNDELFDGKAVLWLLEGITAEINKGSFSGSVDIEKNIKSGKHNFLISAMDNEGNNGQIIKEISIIPVQTDLDIELNDNEFAPEQTIIMKALLYDQAGDRMASDVLFSVFSPDGKNAFSKFSITGSETKYKLPRAAMFGDWKIEAKTSALAETAIIYIKKYAAVDVALKEGIVEVTNIGNIPYSKPIEISFTRNNETIAKVIDVNLEAGQKESYILEAPEGKYDIGVETTDSNKEFGGVPLTGEAISIVELSEVQKEARIRNIIIVFGIIAAALIITLGAKLLQMRKEDIMKRELTVLNNHVNKLKNKYSI